MNFEQTIDSIRAELRLLAKVRYKLKNQLRKTPEIGLLQGVLKLGRLLDIVPRQVPVEMMRALLFKPEELIQAVEEAESRLLKLAELAERYLQNYYMVPFASMALSSAGRIWACFDRLKGSLQTAHKAMQQFQKISSKRPVTKK